MQKSQMKGVDWIQEEKNRIQTKLNQLNKLLKTLPEGDLSIGHCSKSESMIAIALSEHEIPFRYENLITIDNATFAPDFTILHPQTGQIMYWEHFGLMEDEKYLNDFSHKIMCYAKNQIYLGENLIATFETSDCPLDYQSINNKIKQFLK